MLITEDCVFGEYCFETEVYLEIDLENIFKSVFSVVMLPVNQYTISNS